MARIIPIKTCHACENRVIIVINKQAKQFVQDYFQIPLFLFQFFPIKPIFVVNVVIHKVEYNI